MLLDTVDDHWDSKKYPIHDNDKSVLLANSIGDVIENYKEPEISKLFKQLITRLMSLNQYSWDPFIQINLLLSHVNNYEPVIHCLIGICAYFSKSKEK